MTQWTPELEALIRRYSEYHDEQMRDALNPTTSAEDTLLRMDFRHESYGKRIYTKICAAMNMDASSPYNDTYEKNMQQMVDLAAQNGSDAADKLKKVLDVGRQILGDRKDPPSRDPVENIRRAKLKNIQY